METGITIPALLRQVRGERRKQDMAEELGVSPASYGRWERGDTPFPFDRLPWLADLVGIEVDELRGVWQMDAGGRAMRRAVPADDVEPLSLLRDVTKRQEQIADALLALVDRIDRLEAGRRSTRRKTS